MEIRLYNIISENVYDCNVSQVFIKYFVIFSIIVLPRETTFIMNELMYFLVPDTYMAVTLLRYSFNINAQNKTRIEFTLWARV